MRMRILLSACIVYSFFFEMNGMKLDDLLTHCTHEPSINQLQNIIKQKPDQDYKKALICASHRKFKHAYRFIKNLLKQGKQHSPLVAYLAAFQRYVSEHEELRELDPDIKEIGRVLSSAKNKEISYDRAILFAAKLQFWSVVNYLFGLKFKKETVIELLKTASLYGNYDLVEKIIKLPCLRSKEILDRAMIAAVSLDADNVAIVKLLKDKGAAITRELIMRAVMNGNVKIVTYFLRNYSNICKERDSQGRTLLHKAVFSRANQVEMTKLLLNHDFIVNESDATGYTPLEVLLLFKKGYDLTPQDVKMVEILLAQKGYFANEVNVELMRDRSECTVEEKPEKYDTKIFYYKYQILHMIEKAQRRSQSNDFLLCQLIWEDKINMSEVKNLIRNSPRQNYGRALIYATIKKRPDIILYLLKNHDTCIQDGHKLEALEEALSLSLFKEIFNTVRFDEEVLEYLLFCAAEKGNAKVVEFLLHYVVRLITNDLDTLLMKSATFSNKYVIDEIIQWYEYIIKNFDIEQNYLNAKLRKAATAAFSSEKNELSWMISHYIKEKKYVIPNLFFQGKCAEFMQLNQGKNAGMLWIAAANKRYVDCIDIILLTQSPDLMEQIDQWFYISLFASQYYVVYRLLTFYEQLNPQLKLDKIEEGLKLIEKENMPYLKDLLWQVKQGKEVSFKLDKWKDSTIKDSINVKKGTISIPKLLRYTKDTGYKELADRFTEPYVSRYITLLHSGFVGAIKGGNNDLIERFFHIYNSYGETIGKNSLFVQKFDDLIDLTFTQGNAHAMKLFLKKEIPDKRKFFLHFLVEGDKNRVKNIIQDTHITTRVKPHFTARLFDEWVYTNRPRYFNKNHEDIIEILIKNGWFKKNNLPYSRRMIKWFTQDFIAKKENNGPKIAKICLKKVSPKKKVKKKVKREVRFADQIHRRRIFEKIVQQRNYNGNKIGFQIEKPLTI